MTTTSMITAISRITSQNFELLRRLLRDVGRSRRLPAARPQL